MSRRNKLDVTICRGGRCGGPKHREFDHDGQLEAITSAVESAGATVRVTECLALCSASNVVVVRKGRDRTFLGRLADDEASSVVVAWLADGASDDGALADAAFAYMVDPAAEFEQTD